VQNPEHAVGGDEGGMRRAVTISPLSAPTSRPQPMPVTTPSATEPLSFITVPARQADSATVAPTDRSSPPQENDQRQPGRQQEHQAGLAQDVEQIVGLQEDAGREAQRQTQQTQHDDSQRKARCFR